MDYSGHEIYLNYFICIILYYINAADAMLNPAGVGLLKLPVKHSDVCPYSLGALYWQGSGRVQELVVSAEETPPCNVQGPGSLWYLARSPQHQQEMLNHSATCQAKRQ